MHEVQTDGFSFVEFVSPQPLQLVELFRRFGFRARGQSSQGAIILTQGAAAFIVNGDQNPFCAIHGASVRGIGIRVNDGIGARDRAAQFGARPASSAEDGAFVVEAPVIVGIGGSLVYFVDFDITTAFELPCEPGQALEGDASIIAIDHTSNIVRPENLDRWATFYRESLGFVEKQYLEVKGHMSGMRARSMVAPCGRVSIPIAAAAHDRPGVLNQNDEFIRDYNGEGIQHIALLTSNIEATIAAFLRAGVEFMDPPGPAYYEGINHRIPDHGLDTPRLARKGILVDGTGPSRLLLQRFTRRQIGPVFFEIIERRGEDGFGEGNFKALFESQEQDQKKRGSFLG